MADRKIHCYLVESRAADSKEWMQDNCPTKRDVLRVVEEALDSGAVYVKVSAMFPLLTD